MLLWHSGWVGIGPAWPQGTASEVGTREIIGNTARSGSVLRTSYRLILLILTTTPAGRILFFFSLYRWETWSIGIT